jgi:hypothetical protein
MPQMHKALFATCALIVALLAWSTPASAQADEIQVYEGGLAKPGVFNLTIHSNTITKGLKSPSFDGGVVADKSFNGVTEWAYGVTPWFEAGLYLPLYSRDKNLGWGINGFKLRTLFATPNGDDKRFVLGFGTEFSYNAKRWDNTRVTSEFRPILGWHLKPIDIYVNPIFDTAYDGFKNLVFAPSARVAYNLNSTWAIAVEEYADFGAVRDFAPPKEQSHQIFAVFDRGGGVMDVQFGVGVGLTDASDKLTFKLILSSDLNKGRVSKK